jgi:hypothetical protein
LSILAKAQAGKPYGDVKVYVYNKIDAAAFYFENNGSKPVQLNYTLKLKNLKLEESDSDAFEVTVNPGETTLKVLRPIVAGEGTSLGY